MVYIHFPSNHTEEELMLQAKYQKLKKKKKALQAHKAPKQEQEKPILHKRPADARDAREVARKLIKSGAIQAIQRPVTKQDQTSFKRPKGQERKRPAISETAAYQPFASSHSDATDDPATEQEPKRVQDLYQDYTLKRADREATDPKIAKTTPIDATAGSTSPSASPTAAVGKVPEKQKTGNTIYVSGNRLTEEFLHKHFDAFGKVVNISMEIEKGRGFITFGKTDAAEQAIRELNGKAVGGVQLQVQLARRQPQIEPINDASSSATWATLAANQSQKGTHKDNRMLTTYENLFE